MLSELKSTPVPGSPSNAAVDDQLRQHWRRQLEGEWQATWSRLDHETASRPHAKPTDAHSSEGKPDEPSVETDEAKQGGTSGPRSGHSVSPASHARPSPMALAAPVWMASLETGQTVNASAASRVAAGPEDEQVDMMPAEGGPEPAPSVQPAGSTALPLANVAAASGTDRSDPVEAEEGTPAQRTPLGTEAEEHVPQPLLRIRETEAEQITASVRDAGISGSASAELAHALSFALMRMGYSQAQVYVNGAQAAAARGGTERFDRIISPKETSHGD